MMENLAIQISASSCSQVLVKSPCASGKVQNLPQSSLFTVSLRTGSKFSSSRRPVALRHLCKQYVGPRCSTLELAKPSKENEENSSGDSRELLDRQEETDVNRKTGSFNWLEQWYPVAVVKHMDKLQPRAETILGRDLVIWWDRNANRWQVFDDACPHRTAPLSEGRIHESGHLQCSYHGWTFNSSGSCTMIPQLEKGREQALNSSRACVKIYVSMEHQGMIWVWMDRAEGAEERAAANPPPFIPYLNDPNYVFDIGMMDLPYGYELLTENLLDPSHVPFAHHKIQGNRNTARPLNLKVVDSHIQGFSAKREETMDLIFHAPCLSRMDFRIPPPKTPPKGHPLALKVREWIASRKQPKVDEEVKQISTIFFCVPVAPGKSKVIFSFPRNFAQLVFKLTPRWFGHYSHMAVIDSDLLLLHELEHRIQERGGDIKPLYFTPALADTCVMEFRKWFKTLAQGKVDYGAKSSSTLPPRPPRRVLFDRGISHVAKCKICSGAAANFRRLKEVLQIVSVALVGLVGIASSNSWHVLSNFSVPLVCLAIASAVTSIWLSRFIKKMYEYHDYNHAVVE
ncbi:hypothetical protein MPTK1_6g13750 [Marchantia polymorpha subsp. ruderalis]|uniref:Rieske domain-containing protein n=2 Tax=Marchantia polymorpha TaxID=3197 RepID=A0AAF6BRS0_MARPO|nr:hypothetical protein MARPO_0047s0026 [Marchantia polymorpha]BBN14704.1 hypothetical protein Mp_6g13750 [Marchantia polymorpha subsp. ruderalis]|eukprot:PTQ39042.1 hypothetical protein MARPO_0047s0026 [Marchantia polymorpha]